MAARDRDARGAIWRPFFIPAFPKEMLKNSLHGIFQLG
jgi:hypothetical protein